MNRAFLKMAALIVVIAAVVVTNSQTTVKQTTNDMKLRQRISTGQGGGAESLVYIKGQRMRTEMPGGMGFTNILQCDLKRTVMINEKTKTYLISSTDGPGMTGMGEGDGGAGARVPNAQPQAQPTRGGIVNITNTITDTGERKQMFGFTARHIKTSMVKTASPEACDKDQKVETDGWYIDFQYAFECPSQTSKQQTQVRPQQPGCKDEIRTKTIGTAKLGFPLLVTTTIYQPDGRTTSMTQEVLELSREPLSASLFEVPEGYTLAKSMNELYGISETGAYGQQPTNNANAAAATSNANLTAASTAKKPGVIRIGLITPKVETSSGDAARTAETLRTSFTGQLNGGNVEVVALSARQLSQALDEARKSQCDYLLTVSATIKKGGGSMFGRAIGNIASAATGVPTGGVVNAIKAKDELSLNYVLDNLQTSATVLSNTTKAKARSDGEDIITPEVQKASQAILAAVKK
ncbi:MAG TPA: hypothetical protein VFZ22_01795 [Pyrinomonadaceae bacterium]|nr:hypothetical protein [Pyrinomonadaceae bacterium]